MKEFTEKVLSAKTGYTHLFSVGQAGYIIKTKSGKYIGIDLYLSDCVEKLEGHVGFKRLLPKILSPSDIQFDYLVATHEHLDHFDMDSMPELMKNGKTKLFASVECRKNVEKLLMAGENIVYVKPADVFEDDCARFTFINCDHGKGAPDAVGVIAEVDGLRILEVGDSCLRLDRVDEYLSRGKIDIMIAPINGAFGNLDERECALLADALKPGFTIPCHYGMFASHGGNPGKFYEIMKNEYPENKFLLMCQGEQFTF